MPGKNGGAVKLGNNGDFCGFQRAFQFDSCGFAVFGFFRITADKAQTAIQRNTVDFHMECAG